jgi:hypothetical protein
MADAIEDAGEWLENGWRGLIGCIELPRRHHPAGVEIEGLDGAAGVTAE